MAKRPDLTKAERNQIIALYQGGNSGSVVAKKCGVSETTVWSWARRAGVIRDTKEARRMVTSKPHRNWLSSTAQNEIAQRFAAGEKVLSIAVSLGLRYGHIAQFLTRTGIASVRHLKISASQMQEIATRYVAGESAKKLAREYGVSGSIYKLLANAGVKRRTAKEAAQDRRGKQSPKRCFTSEQELEVCRMYESGKSQRVVAEHFKVSVSTIAQARKRHGVIRRKQKYPTTSGKKVLPYASLSGRIYHFRSSWERAFAAYLDSCVIDWEYETRTFPLLNGTHYTPDFWVSSRNQLVEIKGYMWKDAAQKIEMFRDEYPDEHLIVATKNVLPLFTPPTN